jgi:hypothetical protein
MYKLSQEDKTKLQAQVSREQARAEAHTRTWKDEARRKRLEYLLPKAETKDKIKIRKVLNALTVRLAVLL